MAVNLGKYSLVCPGKYSEESRGSGSATGIISFGEFRIIDNDRPTFFASASNAWIKVEAGNPFDPPTPPQYTDYQPGNCYNWAWDDVNARLIYLGSPSYQEVHGHLNLSVQASGV